MIVQGYLEIDPEFTRAEYMLGVALAGKGRMAEAKEFYQRAVRVDPADAMAHSNIFGYRRRRGQCSIIGPSGSIRNSFPLTTTSVSAQEMPAA